MEAFKVGLIIIAAALSACAGAVALKAAGGTAYYYGQVSFLSPDGKLPYNKTDSVVKRETLDGGARIIETVTQPGSGHGMRPKEFVTELKRRKKTLVYDASDAGGAFTGTLTYKDPELKTWTYNIKLKDGEAWLVGVHIAPYKNATADTGHSQFRQRRLLLHRRELDSIAGRVQRRGLTIVPLRVYIKKNHAKIEIGLAKSKKQYDKRQDIIKRESDREIGRRLKQNARDKD